MVFRGVGWQSAPHLFPLAVLHNDGVVQSFDVGDVAAVGQAAAAVGQEGGDQPSSTKRTSRDRSRSQSRRSGSRALAPLGEIDLCWSHSGHRGCWWWCWWSWCWWWCWWWWWCWCWCWRGAGAGGASADGGGGWCLWCWCWCWTGGAQLVARCDVAETCWPVLFGRRGGPTSI